MADEASGGAVGGGYAAWKGWTGARAASAREAEAFAAELSDVPIGGRDVLEIGFGEGAFLAWARAQGARVAGLERDAGMIAAARSAGFEARHVSGAVPDFPGRTFDIVVAFDVLEHVPRTALVDTMRAVGGMLRPRGLFLARFPNGQSPFGRVHQHGDLTHESVLSPAIAGQLAALAGLDLVRVANSHRPRLGGRLRRAGLAARDGVRSAVEIGFARLYGLERLPLDPNVTALWRRPAA